MPHTRARRQDWQKVSIALCFLLLLIIEALSFWNPLHSRPHLLLIGVYYIALYRASQIPILTLFLLSLLRDGYFGVPLGQSSLIYFLVFFLAKGQRSMLKTPHILIDWLGFTLISLITGLLQAFILTMFQDVGIQPQKILKGVLLTSAFYPLGTWALQYLINLLDRLRGQS